MARTRLYQWYRHFKLGGIDIADQPRSGRPVTVNKPEIVDKVKNLIRTNRRLTVREIAEEIGISHGSCHHILTKILQMRRVSAKYVHHSLTQQHMRERLRICLEMKQFASNNPEFMSNIITGSHSTNTWKFYLVDSYSFYYCFYSMLNVEIYTYFSIGDETWVFGYDPETKFQSSVWKTASSPRPKKFRKAKSKIKVLLVVFFDCHGLIHYEFAQPGQKMNSHFYLQVLRNLYESIRQKRWSEWKSNSWKLHHDNAPAHTKADVMQYLQENKINVLEHPPYSPDLAPADFFLFPKIKTCLKGRRFDDIETIQRNTVTALEIVPDQLFTQCFEKWQRRWNRCIEEKGGYFEGHRSG